MTIRYYPIVMLTGPTPVQWRGQDYRAVATDWDAAGVGQLLVVSGGQRLPAVEAVIRQIVGDAVFDQLPELEAFELSTRLLRAVDLSRQHADAANGSHVRVDSAQIEPLIFAALFLRAYSPTVPVTFRLRTAADTLTVVDG